MHSFRGDKHDDTCLCDGTTLENIICFRDIILDSATSYLHLGLTLSHRMNQELRSCSPPLPCREKRVGREGHELDDGTGRRKGKAESTTK